MNSRNRPLPFIWIGVLFLSLIIFQSWDKGVPIYKNGFAEDSADKTPNASSQKLNQSRQTSDQKRQYDKYVKTLDKTGAALAALTTPEMDQKAVDASMRTWEPQYRSLFVSLGLSETAIKEALGIIHERESKLIELRTNFFRLGSAYRNEYKLRKETEEALAEANLTNLLGVEGFDQLSKMEAERFDQFKRSLGIKNP